MNDSRQIKPEDLFPGLKRWNNGAGVSLIDWISATGSLQYLVGYAELLWPRFVQFDGCTLLEIDEQHYSEWMKSMKGDRTRVEATANHRHILGLFSQDIPSASRDMILFVGRLLKETWSAKLKSDFPSKTFTVSFPEEEDFEDLMEYEITFFENR